MGWFWCDDFAHRNNSFNLRSTISHNDLMQIAPACTVSCDVITDQSIAPCAKVGHSPPRRVIQERGRINYTLDDSSVVLIQSFPSVTYLMQVTTSCPWNRVASD
jgi:hypothetical protein